MEKIKRPRGRPRVLTESFENFVRQCREAHPDWPVSKIRKELFKALCQQLEKNHPSWEDEEIKRSAEKRLPGESSIQKFLATKSEKTSILDIPWSLDKTPDLPAEAIEAIFRVQKWARENNGIELFYKDLASKKGDIIRHGITTGQALWISRLYKTVKDTHFLWIVSYVYRIYELCQGNQFNTWQLDKVLLEGKEKFWLLGANILHSDQSFEAEFKVHMAQERAPMVKIKSQKQIVDEAREKLKQLQAEMGGTA